MVMMNPEGFRRVEKEKKGINTHAVAVGLGLQM